MCITALGGGGILLHLGLRYSFGAPRPLSLLPLAVLLIAGGIPLVIDIVRELLRGNFGADLLAGISILAAVLFGEYLVGAILVLMVSGGVALEQFATRRASSVLDALARRTPRIAHRRLDSGITDVPIREIAIGDALLLFPHEICPVDGVVLDGHGVMDESYLTGEPFVSPKTPGAPVLSGSINGETALTIVAEKLAVDSRYARIMAVVGEAQHHRPRLRRIADRVGVWYTPLAVGVALLGWAVSGDPFRFLAVMVIATPCPLLIAVPVAIIGAIALSARRSIIIKNPTVLERIDRCRTLVFDKTGTLTYGRPSLTEVIPAAGFTRDEVLRVAASLEQYSKHPLAGAVLAVARAAQLDPQPVSHISEAPGDGLRGELAGRRARITGRGTVLREHGSLPAAVPTLTSGMECLLFIDDAYAGAFRFHDAPRRESRSFVSHLQPRHGVSRIMLVSGDRESEVRYLADLVGITDVHAGKTPEEKVAIVRAEARRAPTLFVGDGLNDAPALMAATVGVAFGQHSDITVEAADAVVLETSLGKVDELIHIGRRMRAIALQSAIGGMALSAAGMVAAATGHLPPLAGAIAQEVIDVVAVLNALRVALPVRTMVDY